MRIYLLLAAFILGTVGGYNWKLDIYEKERNKTQVHIFKGYLGTSTTPAYGFACVCKKENSSSTSWNGFLDVNCDNTQYPDKPIRLDDTYWIPPALRISVQIPQKACCKAQPRTKDGNLPNVKVGTQCWKSG